MSMARSPRRGPQKTPNASKWWRRRRHARGSDRERGSAARSLRDREGLAVERTACRWIGNGIPNSALPSKSCAWDGMLNFWSGDRRSSSDREAVGNSARRGAAGEIGGRHGLAIDVDARRIGDTRIGHVLHHLSKAAFDTTTVPSFATATPPGGGVGSFFSAAAAAVVNAQQAATRWDASGYSASCASEDVLARRDAHPSKT